MKQKVYNINIKEEIWDLLHCKEILIKATYSMKTQKTTHNGRKHI